MDPQKQKLVGLLRKRFGFDLSISDEDVLKATKDTIGREGVELELALDTLGLEMQKAVKKSCAAFEKFKEAYEKLQRTKD